MSTALLRPYMRGAVHTVQRTGDWPRSFVVTLTDDHGQRCRAEYTLHTEGSALFTLESTRDNAMVDPPVVGWVSWSDGEVVCAFRDAASGTHGGGFLPDCAPVENGPFQTTSFDVGRWIVLAQELLRTVEDSRLT